MPSDLIVEVVEIQDVEPHPGADRLAVARCGDWPVVVGLDQYGSGDLVVFVPPDSAISGESAEALGVRGYLSEKTNIHGKVDLVVKKIRLRGEPSFGLVLPGKDPLWVVGKDVAEDYGVSKYEPPVRATAGDASREHPLFSRYTSLTNLRSRELFEDDEPVVMTEKIHGTNCRIGWIDGELIAGSHRLQRKRPEGPIEDNPYWVPASIPGVVELLQGLGESGPAILYGEVYGPKIGPFNYGAKSIQFVAFDLSMGGIFQDYEDLKSLCDNYGIPMAPELYRGPYSMESVRQHASGAPTFGGNHVREGVVVRPEVERVHPRYGRTVLKYVSDGYLLSKKVQKADVTDV